VHKSNTKYSNISNKEFPYNSILESSKGNFHQKSESPQFLSSFERVSLKMAVPCFKYVKGLKAWLESTVTLDANFSSLEHKDHSVLGSSQSSQSSTTSDAGRIASLTKVGQTGGGGKDK